MNNSIHTKLLERKEKLAVIGLGYVGLPIALEFAKKMDVIGFDINEARVDLMKNNIDPSNELESSDFEGCSIEFTANIDRSEEHTSELQSRPHLVCRLLLEKKKKKKK